MKHLFLFLGLTLFGSGAGYISGFNPLNHPLFSLFATIALTIGLYVSVAGIDLEALGKYKKTAIFITTLGVPLQIAATAAVMWLIYPHPISLLLAVAIDQIDPLSVSTLLNNKLGMSKEAKALLRVWASFDDPVTVLVGFAFLIPLLTGVVTTSFTSYAFSLLLNLIPAGLLFIGKSYSFLENKYLQILVISLSFAFSVYFEAFLFAALAGLVLRPFNADKLSGYTTYLYYLVILVVGASVVHYGLDLRLGILLAIVEFFIVQPLSALFMVKGTTNDIFRLAFAQQNGLTTILMGLAFQAMGFNVLPILLPAIIAVNFFNLTINGYYSWKEARGEIITKVDQKELKKYQDQLALG